MSNSKWDRIHKLSAVIFSKIKHEDQQQKYVLLLTVRVTELCNDAFLLSELNRIASIPIILRSAIESYIDLICIKNDESHIDQMNSSFDSYREKLQTNKFDKNTSPTIFSKFKNAGEKELYDGFYSYLCRSAHGNIEILVRDHAIDGSISIGHTQDMKNASLYRNQIIALASSTLITALDFVGYAGPEIAELHEIRTNSGAGTYA